MTEFSKSLIVHIKPMSFQAAPNQSTEEKQSVALSARRIRKFNARFQRPLLHCARQTVVHPFVGSLGFLRQVFHRQRARRHQAKLEAGEL